MKWTTTDLGKSNSYKTGYNFVAFYIINYIIPFSMLTYMTVQLIRALRKSQKRREEMTRKKRDDEDVTRTLISVVIIFMICQLTTPMRRLIVAIVDENHLGCGYFYFYYRPVGSFFPALNSAVNFLLYCLFGRRFRDDCKKKILGKYNKVGDMSESQNNTNEQTRTNLTTRRTDVDDSRAATLQSQA